MSFVGGMGQIAENGRLLIASVCAKRMLKGPFGPGARVIDWERELNDLRERGYI